MKIFQSLLIILVSFSQIGNAEFEQIRGRKTFKYLSRLESEVLAELNLARQNPKRYARFLEREKTFYVGRYLQRPGEVKILTMEGVSAVDEAIRFLLSAKKISPLKLSRGMSLGARDHVRDQGFKGSLGHKGSDGSLPWDRVSRYGKWKTTVGENIAYGRDTARDIVMGLIIDDGVADRGHRKNNFNSNFKIAGIAVGHHKTYGTMCVITFAGGFEER